MLQELSRAAESNYSTDCVRKRYLDDKGNLLVLRKSCFDITPTTACETQTDKQA